MKFVESRLNPFQGKERHAIALPSPDATNSDPMFQVWSSYRANEQMISKCFALLNSSIFDLHKMFGLEPLLTLMMAWTDRQTQRPLEENSFINLTIQFKINLFRNWYRTKLIWKFCKFKQ